MKTILIILTLASTGCVASLDTKYGKISYTPPPVGKAPIESGK